MQRSRQLLTMLIKRDPLNHGSSMTLGSKGHKLHPGTHRMRMPWLVARETVPTQVLSRRDKAILDGKQLIGANAVERMAQVDPLDALKSAVAERQFLTSTGKNVFQLAAQVPFEGRGQRIYRPEWMEGTYEKFVTISAIDISRNGNNGRAYGYVTFHGETCLYPVPIRNAHLPGWVMDFDPSKAVPPGQAVIPPPSIGTDVPVDPKKHRLKSYPYYDPPNPREFVEKLLKDRGVLPDPPIDPNAPPPPTEESDDNDGSVPHKI